MAKKSKNETAAPKAKPARAVKEVKEKKKVFTPKQLEQIEQEVQQACLGELNMIKRNEIKKRIMARYRRELLK